MPKIDEVLVTIHGGVPEKYRERMQQAAPDAKFIYAEGNEPDPEVVARTKVWLGNPSMSKIAAAKELRWVQLNSAGADYYCKQQDQLPQDLTITNASGGFGLSIAEYMVGSVLMLMRKLHLYRDNQNKQLWERRGAVRSIYGSTILIVGLGDIGGEFGQRVKALGAYTIGVRRSVSQKPAYIDELHHSDALDDLLPRADVVALCLPSTPQTRGMFDARRLSLMKQDSYIVNVGRGDAIDLMAVRDMLQSGQLAGAVLDVTDPEPLPADHLLWLEENALITPHCSGNFDLEETQKRVMELCIENLRRYGMDEPLLNVVDLETGYRVMG